MTILLTGGSGCGKSAFAEKIISAMPRANRVYIATMRVCDAECERKVAGHVRRRSGMDFRTLEQPRALGEADVPPGGTVLLEDIPNLLANEMFGGDRRRILPDLRALAAKCANLVMVTNDVFSDGGTYEESTREYMRELAEINRAAAAMADCAAEIVYGIPVPLKGVLPCV